MVFRVPAYPHDGGSASSDMGPVFYFYLSIDIFRIDFVKCRPIMMVTLCTLIGEESHASA